MGSAYGERSQPDLTKSSLNTSRQAVLFASDANAHIRNQQYHQALTDIEAALTLAPHHAKNRFLYCMLKERVGEPLPQACYAQVVEELSQNSDTPCEANLNCVVADLMAEGEHALERKEQFLNLPASEVETEVWHYLLDDFERDRYLHMILP